MKLNQRRFRALRQVIELSYDVSLESVVDAHIRTYPRTAAPPNVCYELRCSPTFSLWRDGQHVNEGLDANELVALWELDFYTTLQTRTENGLLLHAACLAWQHVAFVLCAPSNVGKSTLAYWAAKNGADYLSDEYTFISQEQTVSGLCRPIALRDFDHEKASANYDFAPYCYNLSSPKGPIAQWLLMPPFRSTEVPQLGAMVLLNATPFVEGRVLSPSHALLRLWSETKKKSPQALRLLVSLLDSTPCWDLGWSTPEQRFVSLQKIVDDTLRQRPRVAQ